MQNGARYPSLIGQRIFITGAATGVGTALVRVNIISPGWVATPQQLATWLTPEEEANWMTQVALPKRLMSEDVANLALFLASNDSSMLSGQNFTIDSGRT